MDKPHRILPRLKIPESGRLWDLYRYSQYYARFSTCCVNNGTFCNLLFFHVLTSGSAVPSFTFTPTGKRCYSFCIVKAPATKDVVGVNKQHTVHVISAFFREQCCFFRFRASLLYVHFTPFTYLLVLLTPHQTPDRGITQDIKRQQPSSVSHVLWLKIHLPTRKSTSLELFTQPSKAALGVRRASLNPLRSRKLLNSDKNGSKLLRLALRLSSVLTRWQQSSRGPIRQKKNVHHLLQARRTGPAFTPSFRRSLFEVVSFHNNQPPIDVPV